MDMNLAINNYEKLRPWQDSNYCNCENIKRILLFYAMHDNPIHCYECKGIIDPETINLSPEQVDEISSWHSNFSALYDLWLDSGEYANFAGEKLADKNSQVNLKGVSLARRLSETWPTYYWWFYDYESPTPQECPNCNQPLDGDQQHAHGKCHSCHIVI